VEFFAFIVKLTGFYFRNGIFAGERRKFFDVRPHFGSRQFQDTFRMVSDVVGSFSGLGKTEKKGLTERPERGNRSEIGRAVLI
jgi:hypothetical protein